MGIQLSDRIILAIESSCDDTSAAVLRGDRVLSNRIAGQAVHKQFGGVVPELASRAHQANIVPVVEVALKDAGVGMDDIAAVAYTRGPGLLGSLLVGTSFAKSLALARGIPLLPVHHMEAHVLAHFIKDSPEQKVPETPFLCLTVSGGHTQIVQVESDLSFTVLGETSDDAAGEAFDKIGKLMGLPYPAGPMIDAHAKKGDPQAFRFPQSKSDGLDFSFSGLKTSVLYFLQKAVKEDPSFVANHVEDLCASVQHAIVQPLVQRMEKAADQTGITTLAIAGGVSANSGLRETFRALGVRRQWQTFIPPMQYCTDNAAMIGIAGQLLWQAGKVGSLSDVPVARWHLSGSRR